LRHYPTVIWWGLNEQPCRPPWQGWCSQEFWIRSKCLPGGLAPLSAEASQYKSMRRFTV